MRTRLIATLARLVTGVFFRQVDVIGAERIPARDPVLLVANHPNGLIDPILILGFLPRAPRFLAKSTLWANPFVLPLLQLARVIPVYRRTDPGVDPEKNQQTFARCHAELARGEAIALFPEGVSYHAPQLQQLRTGAARIAVGAEVAFGPLRICVVPVGLTFERKAEFRSRVLVQVGEPIAVAGYTSATGVEDRDRIRELTEAIGAGLEAVTFNTDSWREAELIQTAADVFANASSALPTRPSLVNRVPLRRRFASGYRELRQRAPNRVHAVVSELQGYTRELDASGLEDRHVVAQYAGVRRWTLRQLLWLGLLAPLAALGAIAHWLPYRLAGWIGNRVQADLDQPATYKLLASLLLLPLFWFGWACGAARLWGSGAGWVALGVTPLLGLAAVGFQERGGAIWREARAYWTLRRRPQAADWRPSYRPRSNAAASPGPSPRARARHLRKEA